MADLTDAELEALHVTIHRLEQRWNVQPVPDNSVFHAYDPLPIAEFLPMIRVATQHATGRLFLDVGCGIGTKLALMASMGWRVAGIDRSQQYIDAARDLVPEAFLVAADLRDIDDFNADVVYMYRPGVSDALENALERHVIERMQPGSVLALPNRRPSADFQLAPTTSPWVWVR